MGEVINAGYIKNFFQLGDTRLDYKVLEAIIQVLIPRRCSHNAVICRYGVMAESVFFIDSGVCSVLDKAGRILGQLGPGQCFGEYAALSGEKRPAAVAAQGEVTLYELRKKYLLKLVARFPGLYGVFLKRVYDSASGNHRRLTAMLNSRRGIAPRTKSPEGSSGRSLPVLIVTYTLVAALFVAAGWYVTPAMRNDPWVIAAPFGFLLLYVIVSGRILESLVLSVFLAQIIRAGRDCLPAFYESITGALTGGKTAEIIVLMALMGVMIQLLTASGSIDSLGALAKRRFKTGRGVLLASLFSMILIFVDDLFALLITGACFGAPADARRIPREKQAVLIGLFPSAVCVLNPLSIWGIYILGLMGAEGQSLFAGSLGFNFTALLIILFSLLLTLGFPWAGPLGRARKRVAGGGALWPSGSEQYGIRTGESRQGKCIHLLLPLLVLIVSSLGVETLRTGMFRISFTYGLLITLGFMFFLYCFQRSMSPEQFFGHVIHGIESMLVPMVLLVMVSAFSRDMDSLGLFSRFEELIRLYIGATIWLLPCLLFVFFSLLALFFGSAWIMYVIGIPMAVQMAAATGGNGPLFLGAVCAAGLAGANLSMQVGDLFIVGAAAGIEPMAYYRAQFPYTLTITLLSAGGYAAAGWLLA
ncbi:MAG: cyclic nucleotide-binding domain-containing protein [Treponema sp.]|jgi:Na+/H+ antiporter NhaC/CRP-like cAMP-binding protein|nr:cyclic nucleotide-binding domain-containing protein [Treponema sp.]